MDLASPASHPEFDLAAIGAAIEQAPDDIASYRAALDVGRAAIHRVFESGAPARTLLTLQTTLTDL